MKKIDSETRLYQLAAYAAMFAEFTMIIGAFIAFLALLYWAGII